MYKELKQYRRLKELQSYTDIYSNLGSIDELLDDFISHRVAEYESFHPESFNGDYITDIMQVSIIHEVFKDCLRMLSPTIMVQLSAVYNPDMINEIILNKVTMNVTSLVVLNNSPEDVNFDQILT